MIDEIRLRFLPDSGVPSPARRAIALVAPLEPRRCHVTAPRDP
jgi:hypothetical protein